MPAARRADALIDILEDEILMGVLRPGDRLEELALAERFGVSRTPIREALMHLAASGLTETRPHRGTFVAALTPQRLIEMFDVMAELEAACAARTARRATSAEIAAIRAAHDASSGATRSGDGDGYYYANERFHEAIRRACRNRFLIEQAEALQKRLKPYRRLQLRARNRLRTSFAEHAHIVRAIEDGSPDAAASRMREHVAVQGERYTDLLLSMDQTAPS